MFLIPGIILFVIIRVLQSMEYANKIKEDIHKIYFNELINRHE